MEVLQATAEVSTLTCRHVQDSMQVLGLALWFRGLGA